MYTHATLSLQLPSQPRRRALRTKDLYDFANMAPVEEFLKSQELSGLYMPDLFTTGWLIEHGRDVQQARSTAAAAAS